MQVYFTFEKFGAIEDVHLPKDAGGRPKGFAFVPFRDLQSAEEAIQVRRFANLNHPAHQRKRI